MNKSQTLPQTPRDREARPLTGMAIGSALLVLLIALAIVGCSAQSAPVKPTPTAAASVKGLLVGEKIVAEGRVIPVKRAALSFSIGGTVTQVPAALGEHVEAGAVLVRLDTRQLELQLAQAEANVAASQAAYDKLLHPDANELTALKADVDKAKTYVDQAQGAYDRIGGDTNPFAGMTPQRAQLQSAWIEYQRALAIYNNKTDPSSAQGQQVKATLDAALAARDLVADQLSRAKIVAPFAGTIASLDARANEQVTPGTPVVRLADYSAWQVETTDLTELNVVNVHEGNAVTVTFDAIPELELTGKVVNIKGFGENRQGDIVYTVVVQLDKQDARLRWNMTAKVTIEPK